MDSDSDSDSDFYGGEEMISSLETRVARFNAGAYWSSYRALNPINLRLTPRAVHSITSQSLPSSMGHLHNRYADIPHAAWQLSESLDTFLSRLPPATTDRGPDLEWILVANPYIPCAEPSPSLTNLIQSGQQRLQLFKASIGAANARSTPIVGNREIARARKEVVDDLTNLATESNMLSGKWMLFPEPSRVNEVWATVARATVNNELGIGAKVATRIESEKQRLICVYTSDFRDKNDVARVLKRLKELELVKPGGRQIYYKCDAWTYLGIYGGNELGISASIYSSNAVFDHLEVLSSKAI